MPKSVHCWKNKVYYALLLYTLFFQQWTFLGTLFTDGISLYAIPQFFILQRVAFCTFITERSSFTSFLIEIILINIIFLYTAFYTFWCSTYVLNYECCALARLFSSLQRRESTLLNHPSPASAIGIPIM